MREREYRNALTFHSLSMFSSYTLPFSRNFFLPQLSLESTVARFVILTDVSIIRTMDIDIAASEVEKK